MIVLKLTQQWRLKKKKYTKIREMNKSSLLKAAVGRIVWVSLGQNLFCYEKLKWICESESVYLSVHRPKNATAPVSYNQSGPLFELSICPYFLIIMYPQWMPQFDECARQVQNHRIINIFIKTSNSFLANSFSCKWKRDQEGGGQN